jgi:hypothetical protein
MEPATATDVLASSAGPITPNLAAWVTVFVTAYVGGSIAEGIPKVRDMKWLRFVASALGWFVGALIAWSVVDYVFDVGSSATAAPGWVSLVTAFVVASVAVGFVTAGIAHLIPGGGASRWSRRAVFLLGAAVTATIVWFVAYYAFDVALPGPLS